jgi:hypothetical protein
MYSAGESRPSFYFGKGEVLVNQWYLRLLNMTHPYLPCASPSVKERIFNLASLPCPSLHAQSLSAFTSMCVKVLPRDDLYIVELMKANRNTDDVLD